MDDSNLEPFVPDFNVDLDPDFNFAEFLNETNQSDFEPLWMVGSNAGLASPGVVLPESATGTDGVDGQQDGQPALLAANISTNQTLLLPAHPPTTASIPSQSR